MFARPFAGGCLVRRRSVRERAALWASFARRSVRECGTAILQLPFSSRRSRSVRECGTALWRFAAFPRAGLRRHSWRSLRAPLGGGCRFSSRRGRSVRECAAEADASAPPKRVRVRRHLGGRRSIRECAAEASASAPPSGRSPQHTRVRRRGERECAAIWAVAARAVAVFPRAEAVGVSVVTLISVLWSVPPPLTAVRLRWGQSFEGMAPGCCPIRRLVLCRRLRARVLATEKVICGSGSSKFSFVWEFREFRSPR